MGKVLSELFLGQGQGTEGVFLHRREMLAKAPGALLVSARGSQYWALFSSLEVNLQKY